MDGLAQFEPREPLRHERAEQNRLLHHHVAEGYLLPVPHTRDEEGAGVGPSPSLPYIGDLGGPPEDDTGPRGRCVGYPRCGVSERLFDVPDPFGPVRG